MRIWNKNIALSFIWSSGFYYPSPVNFTYFWGFGSLALVFLFSQILTGIFLSMHYIPNVELAFYSVEHITLDVNYGWFVRYLHSNGASMFFLVVYIHIFRGLYYTSFAYPRQLLWVTGVVILLLMIIVGFLGYVLPWGQMSFWAATVITNLVSAVPYIGNEVLIWLWGGFSVGNATLNRFFSLHFLLPFVLLLIALLHVLFLHEFGSNNPIGLSSRSDDIYLNPYYTLKDWFGLIIFSFIYLYFVFFNPNYLGHSDNYILANPMVTPTHIVPEWYLLPFYAILRSVPNKLLGVIMLLGAIIILACLPFYLNFVYRSTRYKVYLNFFFWIFFFNCLVLGWIGGKPVEPPFYLIGQVSTFFYFFYFLFILPFFNYLELAHLNYKKQFKKPAKLTTYFEIVAMRWFWYTFEVAYWYLFRFVSSVLWFYFFMFLDFFFIKKAAVFFTFIYREARLRVWFFTDFYFNKENWTKERLLTRLDYWKKHRMIDVIYIFLGLVWAYKFVLFLFNRIKLIFIFIKNKVVVLLNKSTGNSTDASTDKVLKKEVFK